MTRASTSLSAKQGKRKKRSAERSRRSQKAGLNKSILDVGMGMLRAAIQYKVTEAGGVFVEVPTKTVKPSQTCPQCGNQHKKSLDERVHQCRVCGFTMDRDLAAALVMLLWSQGKLPGLETSLVDADAASSTSDTRKRKFAGSQKQLGQVKRQKSKSTGVECKTHTSTQ
jgi:putative transposase